MGEINGSFFYNGKPINGAMAKLWQKSVFTGTPPVFDQAEPGSGQQGATITTGTDYGGDGAFRWTGVPAGEYYVSCYYDNHRSWMYAAPSIEQIATTRGDILFRGASVLERLAKGAAGYFLKQGANDPEWQPGPTGGPTVARKTANQSVNNSTTVVDCTDMVIPVLANEVWAIELFARMSTPTGAGLRSGFTAPTGATFTGFYHDMLATTNAAYLTTISNMLSQKLAWATDVSQDGILYIKGIYVGGADAGNVQFQFAQRVATAGDTTVYANAFMIAHKLLG